MKTFLFLLAMLFAVQFSYAQTNTFPTSGSVGIGTTSPAAILEVSKSNNFGEVMRISNTSTNSPFINFYTNGARSSYIGHGSNNADFLIQSQTGNISLYPNNTLAMTLTTNGNVGIGTSSPTTLLDVNGVFTSGSFSANINAYQPVATHRYNGISGVSYPGEFRWYTSPSNSLYKDAAKYQLRAWDIGSGTENTILTIRGDGGIGIGTISPAALLNISSAGAAGNSTMFRLDNTFSNVNNRNWAMGLNTIAYGDFSINQSDAQNGDPNTAGTSRLYISQSGNVGIGTTTIPTGYKVAVNGNVIAAGVQVLPHGDWPDYVFKPHYILPSLSEVKSYIDQNQHLPDMPSAETIEKDGQNIGEMNKLLLKKVEELTLYLIEAK